MSNQQRLEALGPSVPYPQVLAVWADAPGAPSMQANSAIATEAANLDIPDIPVLPFPDRPRQN
jgi:hypothetical protein